MTFSLDNIARSIFRPPRAEVPIYGFNILTKSSNHYEQDSNVQLLDDWLVRIYPTKGTMEIIGNLFSKDCKTKKNISVGVLKKRVSKNILLTNEGKFKLITPIKNMYSKNGKPKFNQATLDFMDLVSVVKGFPRKWKSYLKEKKKYKQKMSLCQF